MIAARRDDGRFGPSQWVPNTAPGHWWPQLNAAGQPILDPTPVGRRGRPLRHGVLLAVPHAGPNSLSSESWATEFNEVKAIGAVTTLRDADARPTSRSGGRAPRRQLERGRPRARRSRRPRCRRRPPPRDAEPQRRRRGDQQLERQVSLRLLEAVERDPPRCGGQQPGYHAGRAGPRSSRRPTPSIRPATSAWTAHTSVLQMFFPDAPAGGFRSPASPRCRPTDPRPRTFGSFTHAIDEVTEARIWAGLHFRTAPAGQPIPMPSVRYTKHNPLVRNCLRRWPTRASDLRSD